MPNHWQETTLGEVASWTSGKSLPASNRKEGGLFPVLGASGEISRTDDWLIDCDAVLVGRVGAVGAIQRTSGCVWVSDNALIAQPTPLVDVDFLQVLLEYFDFTPIVSGNAQPVITQGRLKSQAVSVPPLDEQRRIVDLVGSIDAYIDALEAQIETTRTARSALLAELLSNLGDDWQSTTLSEVANIVSERLDPTMIKETAYVGLEHLVTDQRKLLSWGSTVDVSSSITPFRSGDTLFGRLRPYLRKGCVAEFDGVCSPEILVIRTKGSVDERFIGLLILNSQTFEECVRLSAGTRMPRTSARDLKALSVLIPPLAEQRRIVDLVGSFDEQITGLEVQVSAVRELRSSVLSGLLSGDRLLTDDYDVAVGL